MKLMNKGKNFSGNNLGQRKKSDFYETPYSLTYQLLKVEEFMSPVLEPAAGNGAIVKVLEKAGYQVVSYDKYQGEDRKDFLKERKRYASIVTNPPYSQSFEFIQMAKKTSYKFAFLLPLSYLHGQERYQNIYQDLDFPLTKVYVFTRYPMLTDKLRKDGKYRTGMMVYAWFVWERVDMYPREPIIRWLDNNRFVLKKGDV